MTIRWTEIDASSRIVKITVRILSLIKNPLARLNFVNSYRPYTRCYLPFVIGPKPKIIVYQTSFVSSFLWL